ncbi:hypothetical protein EAF04_006193 [Stromatinia cepivora]|nr:hypothetical protein EAF04_006193 [Stromatinia cepivora]
MPSYQRAALRLGGILFGAGRSARLPAAAIGSVPESFTPHNHFGTPYLAKHSFASKPPTSSFVRLAATISQETAKLSAYVRENGIAEPSFDVDSAVAFLKLLEVMRKLREEIIKATEELGHIVTGAEKKLRWLAWDSLDTLSLRAIYHYDIAKSFPLSSTATFEEIAQKVGLDIVNVKRFMRHAMTNRIFQEVEPNVVAHTAASKLLAEDQPMKDWVGMCVEEIWPAVVSIIDALSQHPSASE